MAAPSTRAARIAKKFAASKCQTFIMWMKTIKSPAG
jgi:hypothetical protein